MPSTFRQSLLVALMLGFIPAGTLTSFAVPVPVAPQAAAAQDSLYKRLGGYDALAAVTDDFLGRLATDPNDSKTRVRQHVVDFLCVATGGPCKYTGRDMETAHTGLNITEEDWTISVKALSDTLNKFKVPAREQGEVINAIAGLKSKIVGR